MNWDALYQAAYDVRLEAYAPYSKFLVGAALQTTDGTIFTGCNVENRSFGLCICAERTAVAKAVSQGVRKFSALAVVTDCSPAGMPCGMCLETLTEFAKDLPILAGNVDGERTMYSLRQLQPTPFEWPENLPL